MKLLVESVPSMKIRGLSIFALCALILISLAGVMAQNGGAHPPASQAQPAGQGKQGQVAEEPTPKIVRWVCTDHLCGGCDGACSRSGHVAVSRKGHCACTPKSGGRLDEAIRKAFQPHLKGH
jgi:hypothetical protein